MPSQRRSWIRGDRSIAADFRGLRSPLASAAAVDFFHRRLLYFVIILEADRVFDLLPRDDPFVLRHSGVVARALQLFQRFLHEVELDADGKNRVYAACEAHVFELRVTVERALV